MTSPITCLPQVNSLPALTGEIDNIAVAYTAYTAYSTYTANSCRAEADHRCAGVCRIPPVTPRPSGLLRQRKLIIR
ncbi:hypothetical protein [Rhizobium leguminosarum]|uniref:hypothetical protein n=1 Tax=Rhizobium leguminosarum TaxID=384 RepID=UPI0014416BB0|nr:hypothetical protein [Rhizobium leguminosarum]NKL81386.1 hypothetical protein [Rhizobium leguminosarum bv. viciae]